MEGEKQESGNKKIMEFMKNIIGEIKAQINAEKSQR
jgi:hypothetical protein